MRHLTTLLLLSFTVLSSTFAIQIHHRNEPTIIPSNIHRHVQIKNNTSSINSILSNLSLSIPSTSVDTDTFLGSLTIQITNTSCDNLKTDNVTVSHSNINSTLQRLSLYISDLSATCAFDYSYSVSFLSGSGSGVGILGNESYISSSYDFTSENYELYPPTDVILSYCESGLIISGIEFNGEGLGIVSSIAGAFESSIASVVEKEMDTLVCEDVLGSEVLDKLNEVVDSVNGRLEPYLEDDAVNDDPLEMENSMDVPTNSEGEEVYVDFQTMRWFDRIQQYAIDNINSLINDVFLTNNGVLEVDPSLLDNSALQITTDFIGLDGTNVTITSLTISGLDTLNNVELLDPIGKYTLQNSFKWEKLTFTLEMEATHDPSEISDVIVQKPDTPPVTDAFTMELTVEDIAVDMAVLLGINMETLGELTLGSLMDLHNLLPCVRSAVEKAAVTYLSVEVSSASPPVVIGFLDEEMNTAVNTATDAFFSMYQSVILQALPNFFGTVVKDMVNDLIDEAEGGTCPEPNGSLQGIVDYRDLLLSEAQAVEMGGRGGSPYGDLMRTVYGALVDIMTGSDSNGMSNMNQVVASMTKNQSGVEGDLYWEDYLFKQSVSVDLNGLNADIAVAISDLKISNLDTMAAPIQLLMPINGESSNLNNSLDIGAGPDPLRASLRLLVYGEGDKTTIDNEMELGISLSSLSVLVDILGKMEEPPFLNFPLRDIFNVNCWLATMVTPELDQYGLRIGEVTMGIEDMAMFVKEAQFEVKCISCSSPLMVEIEKLFESDAGVTDATTTVNAILETLSKFMEGEYIQHIIDQMLHEAPYQCPHSPEYNQNFAGIEYEDLVPPDKDEQAIDFLIAIIVVVLCVIVISLLTMLLVRFITRRRHNRWLKALNHARLQVLAEEDQYETKRQKDLNSRMKSLMFSKEVPFIFKVGIPITIFGNIALFLSGHLSLGGTVNISGSFAGQDFNIEGFFEFSMVKSTIDMWKAGAKELAIMIAIFSGVWPYTKQLISLLMWLISPSYISCKKRGSILHWLDLLGKWSMVDVFVLLTTLASFRITIESPSHVAYLPDGFYEVNMLVVPLWGLYANMLAQLVSQVSSHVIIHYHKKTMIAAMREQEVEWGIVTPTLTEEPEKLRHQNYRLDYEASSKRAIVKNWAHWMLLAALASLTILVILGCAIPSFSIEILGLLGLAVESGNQFDQAHTYYSVFSLAQVMMDEARYLGETSSYIGLGTLASLLVLTVFCVPIFQTLSLFIEWFLPINRKQRHLNIVVNEILSAWQYMEVFVLSVIITSWQLSGVSDYMVNAYCGGLSGMFDTLAFFGIVDANDAQCFQLRATVEAASWLLVAASLILAATSHFVLTASTQKTLDSNVPPEKRRHNDRWSSIESTEVALEESGKPQQSEKPTISPIPPRFTDYYSLIIRKEHIEEEVEFATSAAQDAAETNSNEQFQSVCNAESTINNESSNIVASQQSGRAQEIPKEAEESV